MKYPNRMFVQIATGTVWNNSLEKEMPALYALTEDGYVYYFKPKTNEWVEVGDYES